jgi:hypothetical protein
LAAAGVRARDCSGCQSHWYIAKQMAATTQALIATCQDADGSGSKRGILRTHGKIKMSAPSVASTPVRNQKNANAISPCS